MGELQMAEESNALPSRFAVFSTKDGKPSVVARFENDDVWLTQKHLAELNVQGLPWQDTFDPVMVP